MRVEELAIPPGVPSDGEAIALRLGLNVARD
jgi:hypothetical protein